MALMTFETFLCVCVCVCVLYLDVFLILKC